MERLGLKQIKLKVFRRIRKKNWIVNPERRIEDEANSVKGKQNDSILAIKKRVRKMNTTQYAMALKNELQKETDPNLKSAIEYALELLDDPAIQITLQYLPNLPLTFISALAIKNVFSSKARLHNKSSMRAKEVFRQLEDIDCTEEESMMKEGAPPTEIEPIRKWYPVLTGAMWLRCINSSSQLGIMRIQLQSFRSRLYSSSTIQNMLKEQFKNDPLSDPTFGPMDVGSMMSQKYMMDHRILGGKKILPPKLVRIDNRITLNLREFIHGGFVANDEWIKTISSTIAEEDKGAITPLGNGFSFVKNRIAEVTWGELISGMLPKGMVVETEMSSPFRYSIDFRWEGKAKEWCLEGNKENPVFQMREEQGKVQGKEEIQMNPAYK